MSSLRLFSVYDSAVQAFMNPFFADHKANAIRSFQKIVNEHSSDNMIAAHPDQFVLFELGEFNRTTGEFISHNPPLTLGNGVEYVRQSAA